MSTEHARDEKGNTDMHLRLERVRDASDLFIHVFNHETALPGGIELDGLTRFLHESLKPWEDTPADVRRGLDYALSPAHGRGGFVVLGMIGDEVVGTVVVLRTGMGGYVPRHLLLFAAVAPSWRGKGIGGKLVRRAVDSADGDIALHVELANPARKLYERVGFRSEYVEMRTSSQTASTSTTARCATTSSQSGIAARRVGHG